MAEYKQKINPRTGQFNLVPTNTVIAFKAGVENEAALPADGNTKSDARITNDNGHLWVWDWSAWQDQGDAIDLNWSAITNKPSSSVSNIDDAVSKKHTQNTDTKLDEGGANEVTAANVKLAVSHKDLTNNPHAVTASQVDTTDSGESVQDKITSLEFSVNDKADIAITITEQTEDYTLVLGDAGTMIDMNNNDTDGEVILTVPKNAVVAFPVGTTIAVRQVGTSQVIIAPVDGDVILQYETGLKITGQYGVATLVKIAANTWAVFGALEA